jgi:hypothetical protein
MTRVLGIIISGGKERRGENMNFGYEAGSMPFFDKRIQKDVQILSEFIYVYCTEKHAGEELYAAEAKGRVGRHLEKISFQYCKNCRRLLLHAVSKRVLCPHDPKPSCRKCETHCYGKEYREKIREVMRYSGMRLIARGRLRLIKKYFF